MKNKKGISKLVLLVIIVIFIAALIYWAKYFAKPMATVMMGGAEQAQPMIDKAKKASDTMDRTTQATEEALKKASEDAGK
jgi:F0F1-type ATP synthase membrane subunit b/b'